MDKSTPTFSDLVMAVERAQLTALDNQELRKYFVTLSWRKVSWARP